MSKLNVFHRLTARLLFSAAPAALAITASAAAAQDAFGGPNATNAGTVTGGFVSTGAAGPTFSGHTGPNTSAAETSVITLNANRTILNWNSFVLNANDTLQFVFAANNHVAVNRITGGSGTQINGTLTGNGNVWFFDPAGIAVGSTGVINVAGLLMGTGDISNADFFDGNNAFTLSGSTGTITVATGARLTSTNGALTLVAPAIQFGGNGVSSGGIALVGAKGAEIIFDGDMDAYLALTINEGSSQNTAVDVSASASFDSAAVASGGRTYIIAAGDGVGLGSIILGGTAANQVEFVDGDVVLYAAGTANGATGPRSLVSGGALQSLGSATGGGDVTIGAANVAAGSLNAIAVDDVVVNDAVTVFGDGRFEAGDGLAVHASVTTGSDYIIRADDFLGAATFNPFEGDDVFIEDTAGGLTIGNVSAADSLSITTTGGDLTILGGGLTAGGSVSLSVNNGATGTLTLGDSISAIGDPVTLTSQGNIVQNSGTITSGSLSASAASGIALEQANLIGTFTSLQSSTGNIIARSNVAGGVLIGDIDAGDGDITLASTTGVRLVGGTSDIDAPSGDIIINGPSTVTGAVTLSAAGAGEGTVSFTAAVNGASAGSGNLTVNSASTTTFASSVGATNALGSLNVTASAIDVGLVRTSGNIALTGGSIGSGSRDLDLWAQGTMTLTGASKGRDVALIAGGALTVGTIAARDDIAIVASGSATTGVLTSGTTVDALGPVDAAGAADWLAGATLTGSVTGASSNGLTIGGAHANGVGSAVRLSAGTGALASSGLVAGDTVVLVGNGVGTSAARVNTAANTLSASGGSGGVYINEADAVTLNAGSAATRYDVAAGGSITTAGSISATAGDVVLSAANGGNLAVGASIAAGGGGDIRLTADGTLSSVAGATLTAQDLVLMADDWTGAILSSGTLQETADLIVTDTAGGFTAVSLSAANDLSISTTNGGGLTVEGAMAGGDITLASAGSLALTGAIDATGDTLSLTAAGGISQSPAGIISANTLTGSSGGATELSVGANQILNLGAFNGSGVRIADTGGLTVTGIVSGGSQGVAVTTTGDLTVNGAIAAGTFALLHASGVGSDIVLNSAIAGTNEVGLTAGGTITQTAAGAITGNTGYFAASGAISLAAAANDIAQLLSSGGASFAFADVGGLAIVGAVSGGAGGVNIRTSGDLRVDAGVTSSNAPIALAATGVGADLGIYAPLNAGTGTVSLAAGATIGQNLTGVITAGTLTGSAGGTVLLGASNQVSVLGDFIGDGIVIGDTGGLNITGSLNAGSNDVVVRTAGGDLAIASTGTVTGAEVVLSTDKNFHNASGSDAISAADRWLVYSAGPDGNSYGGLNSGSTAVWNASLATRAPGTITGSRYVFAYQPTLTFTSSNASKIYGTALTTSGFTVSGYHPGVAGAFLADTAGTAYAGGPAMSSAGYAANASVADGPYGIAISAGSLTSASGYAFAFNGTGQLTVDPKAITGSVVANDKTYDGTTDANGTITLDGVLAGDEVTAAALLAFADRNAGSDKTVTISGGSLSGADAGNYTLSLPASVLADIFKKTITGSVVANDKTYDATTDATGTITLSGVVAGDIVNASAILAFASANAGSDKTVTISGGSLSGADAGNYALVLPASTLADIFQKAITGTVVANNKTYDGTTSATGTVALDGVIAGDDVSASALLVFADKNAGSGKTVLISGGSLSGADAGNYVLSLPASVLADIFRKVLTGVVVADDKTYDGSTDATGTITLDGVVAGDAVTASAILAFVNANAGSDKTVTISGAALSGADADNYSVSLPASTLADIFQKALTATVTANNKTYDGTTAATGTVAVSGLIAGDDVTASAILAFADKNAGSNKTVLVTGGALSGASAGNYTLSLPASAIADIFKLAISGTVVANDKTYDGTNAATGTVTLSGILTGDQVTASAILAFADENAGSDKTVTISAGSLSGTDAGNYALTLPASTLADIFRAAITVTANSLSKGQGTADPALTYAITMGQLYGSDTLTGTLSRAVGETPGEYAILQGTLAATTNYEMTFVPGVLTVEPRIVLNEDLRGRLELHNERKSEDGSLLILDYRDCSEDQATKAGCNRAPAVP